MTHVAEPASPSGAGPAVQDRMRSVVEELARAPYAGRRVGTAGGRAALDWLATQLGVATVVDEFHLADAVREVYATPVLQWHEGESALRLRFRRDFCEHLASYDQPSVRRGRLANGGGPVDGAWIVDSAFGTDRIQAWAAAGAAGVLVPRGTDAAGWMPKMIAGPAPVALPVVAVRADIHDRMARTAATGAGWVAASVPIRTADATAANLYATFRPESPGGILLTAHYDGVGDDPDGTRFPAAADNASGVAVVIDAARQLHHTLPPDVGLAVALLDAEEIGARGSAHHAPRVTPGTYVLNVDGAAALGEAVAVEAGGPAHAMLAALDQAGRATGIPLRAGPMPSDNRRYAAAGLPAIGLGLGIPGYQTPAETPDRVQPDTLDAALRLVVAAVELLASGGDLR